MAKKHKRQTYRINVSVIRGRIKLTRGKDRVNAKVLEVTNGSTVIWDSLDAEAQVLLLFAPTDKPVPDAFYLRKTVKATVHGKLNKRYHYIAGIFKETSCPVTKGPDLPAKACPSLEIRDPVIIIR